MRRKLGSSQGVRQLDRENIHSKALAGQALATESQSSVAESASADCVAAFNRSGALNIQSQTCESAGASPTIPIEVLLQVGGKRRIEIIGNDEPSSQQAERATLWWLRWERRLPFVFHHDHLHALALERT